MGIVGVTGTPGTGKKSLAPLLAARLGIRCLGLDDLARSYGLIGGSTDDEAVDTEELKDRLRSFHGSAVLYGHLIPYALERGQVSWVVVLRCEPIVLKERLIRRGYPGRKLIDNVEAELIGLVSSEAYHAFGTEKTFEVDTTKTTPADAAANANEVIDGTSQSSPRIDWTQNYDSGAKLGTLLSAGES